MKKNIFVVAFSFVFAIGAFAQWGNFLKDKLSVGGGNSANQSGNKIFDIAKSSVKMAKGLNGVSLDDEMDIGGSVALQIVSHYGGLVRDDAIMRRVNLVGKSLARYSDRAQLNYRFAVLNSDTVNAFSAPGGYIFITRGLYNTVTNDDELAGVLGHEIAHITEKHALNIIRKEEFKEGAQGVAAATGGSDTKKVLAGLSSNVGEITKTLFTTGFDRKQEFAADQIGSQLAATVGFAPDGLKDCLVSLQKNGSNNKAAIFATHPPLKVRIEKLDAQMASR
jgi:predicted Zn-dependent protease